MSWSAEFQKACKLQPTLVVLEVGRENRKEEGEAEDEEADDLVASAANLDHQVARTKAHQDEGMHNLCTCPTCSAATSSDTSSSSASSNSSSSSASATSTDAAASSSIAAAYASTFSAASTSTFSAASTSTAAASASPSAATSAAAAVSASATPSDAAGAVGVADASNTSNAILRKESHMGGPAHSIV